MGTCRVDGRDLKHGPRPTSLLEIGKNHQAIMLLHVTGSSLQ